MTFDKDDNELYERLRSKYSGLSVSGDLPDQADHAGPSGGSIGGTGRVRTGADLRAHMCIECQGTGVKREQYEFRVLERDCQKCQGDGCVIYKDRVPAAAAAPNRRLVRADSAREPGLAPRLSPETCRERKAKLESDVERIQEKLLQHEVQRREVQQQQAACPDDQRRRLQQAVVEQLDKHLATLQALMEKKRMLILYYGRGIGEGGDELEGAV